MLPKYNIAHQRILNFIADENIGVNSKLPSEKEMAVKIGFSMITIRRALHELEMGNFIERIHGKGTFIKTDVRSKQNAGKIIFLSIGNTSESQYSSGFQTVEEESVKKGYKIQYQKVSEDPEISILDHLADCNGIFLFGWINEKWINFLKSAGIPMVAIGNNPRRDKIPTVYYEYHSGVKILTGELFSRGARKIGFAGHDNSKRLNDIDSFSGYHDALNEHGIEPNPKLWLHEQYSPDQYYAVIKKFLLVNPDLDGLIISGTDMYVNMLNYFFENKSAKKPIIGLILHAHTYQLEHAGLKNTILLMPEENIYCKAVQLLFNKPNNENMTVKFKIICKTGELK